MIADLVRPVAVCPICGRMARRMRKARSRTVHDLSGTVTVRFSRHRCESCDLEFDRDSKEFPSRSGYSTRYIARALTLAREAGIPAAIATLRNETGHSPAQGTISKWSHGEAIR